MNYYENMCDGITHTIRRGDTLYRLSRMYGVSVEKIMDANPNVNIYNLVIGDTLCIPIETNMGQEATGMFWGMMPGQTGAMSGQTGMMAGQNVMAPGQTGAMPGQTGMMPGQNVMTPGQIGMMPGQTGMMSGGSTGMMPGQNSTMPGQNMTMPGQNSGGSNQGTAAPGQNVWQTGAGLDWMVIMPYEVKAGDSLNSILQNFGMDFETFAAYNPKLMPIPLKEGEMVYVSRNRTITPMPQNNA